MTEYLRIEAAGLPVFHAADQACAAHAMAEAAERTIPTLARRWSLTAPHACELHVLTDCLEFIDRTVPTGLRLLLRLTKFFWRRRAERAFALAGGWMLPWPGRPVVGVKPPELLSRADPSLGDRLFVPVADPLEKVRHVTCHELTHACTAHLRLPPWLNEGLAMRAVDHMVGRQTVLDETRAFARLDRLILHPRSYRRIGPQDHDSLIRLYASGYWITRRLEDEHPALLAQLIQGRHSSRSVSEMVKASLDAKATNAETPTPLSLT